MKTALFSETTLVFDLDGTLIDTAPDLIRSLNHTLESANCASMPAQAARSYISFGARRMILEGLKNGGQTPGDGRVDELLKTFLLYYSENIAAESRPYPGIIDILETAREAGARLAVCTNKMAAMTTLLMGELDMTRHFHGIAGRDTFPVCKPDPAHLTGAVALAKGEGKRIVMVGDSATDVNTAKNAGVPAIAVSFGYSEIPAHELGADVVIDSYDAFPAALEMIFG